MLVNQLNWKLFKLEKSEMNSDLADWHTYMYSVLSGLHHCQYGAL
jgi:hypothetical protein